MHRIAKRIFYCKLCFVFFVGAIASTLLASSATGASAGSWKSLGPEGGPVDSVILSPDFARDQSLFAVTGNGIFKSNDSGGNWAKMSIDADKNPVEKIEFSPNYAADKTVFAMAGNGLYKSTDGGRTWLRAKYLNRSLQYETIAISPNYAQDGTIFLNDHVLFRSTDGGRTWVIVKKQCGPNGYLTSFVFSPSYSKDKTIFTFMEEDGLYKSTNRGNSWKKLRNVRYRYDSEFTTIVLSPRFRKDKTVFLTSGAGNLLVSRDGGKSWEKAINGYTRSVSYSPDYSRDKTIFAVVNGALYKSKNRGATWKKLETGLGGYFSAITFSANYAQDRTLYVVRSGGQELSNVFRSADGGKTWHETIGLPGGYGGVSQIAPAPTLKTDGIFFVATGAGVYRSTDKGNTWVGCNKGLIASSVDFVIPSPTYGVDRTIFSGNYSDLYKSTDAGANWGIIMRGAELYNPRTIGVSPNYSMDKTIFIGKSQGLFRSNDGGSSWKKLKIKAPNDYTWDAIIALSPSYAVDKTVYVSANNWSSTSFFKSTDGGGSWHKIAAKAGGNSLIPQQIALSPAYTTDRTVFITDMRSPYLYKSTDGGVHFRRQNKLRGQMYESIAEILVSPNYALDRTVIAISDRDRLYRSESAGKKWHYLDRSGDTAAFSPNYALDKTIFVGFYWFPWSYSKPALSLSADKGDSWTAIPPTRSLLHARIAPSPDYANDKTIFAPTEGGGVASYTFD